MSLTQYAAGGLFRWIKYGFRSEASLKAKNYEEWSRLKKEKKGAWLRAIEKVSKVTHLAESQDKLKTDLAQRYKEMVMSQ